MSNFEDVSVYYSNPVTMITILNALSDRTHAMCPV